jgi:hypothetical protein
MPYWTITAREWLICCQPAVISMVHGNSTSSLYEVVALSTGATFQGIDWMKDSTLINLVAALAMLCRRYQFAEEAV